MTALPLKQMAIVAIDGGDLIVSSDVSVPKLKEDMILVRNRAVGLNPIDIKMVGTLATPGAIAGMDFSGEVLVIGSKAQTATKLKVGDRVFGAVPGMHAPTPTIGAFSEIVGSPDIVTMKLPDQMSFEEGAALGSGICTIGLALFKSLQVPGTPKLPSDKPVDILVYGGSTATGTLALQLLKLSGLNPITTCSPHNFDLVKSYGATAVFDYRSPTCVEDIRKLTRVSLKYVLDCVSEPDTMEFCYRCLGRTGGKYTALEPYPEFLHTRPKTVTPDWVLGPSILGTEIGWPEPFRRDENADYRNFGIDWIKTAQQLLDEGKLKTHPLRVDRGLDRVSHGLELLRNKQISGQKLVYSIA